MERHCHLEEQKEHGFAAIPHNCKRLLITRNRWFSHSAHLAMDLGCGECHPDLFTARYQGQQMTMDAMNEGQYCGACHDGWTAFSVAEDCESCQTM
jgi:c(7)-type cytochrome triheme protein